MVNKDGKGAQTTASSITWPLSEAIPCHLYRPGHQFVLSCTVLAWKLRAEAGQGKKEGKAAERHKQSIFSNACGNICILNIGCILQSFSLGWKVGVLLLGNSWCAVFAICLREAGLVRDASHPKVGHKPAPTPKRVKAITALPIVWWSTTKN